MKTIEWRKIEMGDLRNLCIKNNWYTCGDCQEYSEILHYAHNAANVTTADIVHIAEDIKSHNETEYEVLSICFEVARICYSIFEEVSE